MKERPRHVQRWFVLLTVVLGLGYVVADGTARMAIVSVAGIVPMVVLLVLLARRRITDPTPWWFVLAGLVLLSVRNAVVLSTGGPAQDLDTIGESAGTWAAVTVPLGYLSLLLGAVLLTVPYFRSDSGGVIDSAIIGLSGASLLWTFVLYPALDDRREDLRGCVYTLLILLLISGTAGAVARAAVAARAARPSLTYLLVAVLANLGGNVAGVVTADRTTGEGAWWTGLLWIVGSLALAAAAAQPSHHLPASEPRATGLTPGRLAFLGLALTLHPALGAVHGLRGETIEALLLSLGSLVLVPLVLLRIAQLSRQRDVAEARLAFLATRDELTGLPNRRALTEHLAELLPRVRRGEAAGAAVLFCDLDDFKMVNDIHGHPVGDDLLVAVSGRLQGTVRARDIVARFGGDEFVVVVEGDPDVVANETATRIVEVLSDPVQLGDIQVSPRASIGVAVARPGTELTVDQMLSQADLEMYVSKRERRSWA